MSTDNSVFLVASSSSKYTLFKKKKKMACIALLYRNGQKFYSTSEIFGNPVLLCTLAFCVEGEVVFLFPSWSQLWFNKQKVSYHAIIWLCQEENRYEVFFYKRKKTVCKWVFWIIKSCPNKNIEDKLKW